MTIHSGQCYRLIAKCDVWERQECAKRFGAQNQTAHSHGRKARNCRRSTVRVPLRKVAVNVLRHPGNPRNELQDVLRRWFGPDAGLPGTNFQVAFRPTRAGWTLEPLKPARADAPAI